MCGLVLCKIPFVLDMGKFKLKHQVFFLNVIWNLSLPEVSEKIGDKVSWGLNFTQKQNLESFQ